VDLDQGRDSRIVRRLFRRLRNYLQPELRPRGRLGRLILCSFPDLRVRPEAGNLLADESAAAHFSECTFQVADAKPKAKILSRPQIRASIWITSPARGVNIPRVRSSSGNASATISERMGASGRKDLRPTKIDFAPKFQRARARARASWITRSADN